LRTRFPQGPLRKGGIRHAGLDPASTFFLHRIEKKVDPDQVRGDDSASAGQSLGVNVALRVLPPPALRSAKNPFFSA